MKNPLFTRPVFTLTDALIILFIGVFLGSTTSLIWKAHWLTPSDTPTEITTAKK